MSELRQNMATREWVVVASERAKRPDDFASKKRELTGDRPERDPGCPFCPGNEEPSLEISRVPESGPWGVRVVRNKFPALVPVGDPVRAAEGVHRSIPGVGHHEVIIESPRHNTCMALEKPEDIALFLNVFQGRARALADDPRVEHVICFKNHGETAGTSLVHPHAQLVALPIVPHEIRVRTEEARRHFDDNGSCVFCDMLRDEIQDGVRVVVDSDHFVAFIPFAAPSPFHTWVLPRRHEPSFLRAKSAELVDLADVLHRVLRKIYIGLNDPDYNYVVRTASVRDQDQDYLHWYLSIIPRVARTAGFELGSGMYINPAVPEANAEFLRSVDEDSGEPRRRVSRPRA
jgi:UDPglucose--hexose-1-phosphate uridylyltransferase